MTSCFLAHKQVQRRKLSSSPQRTTSSRKQKLEKLFILWKQILMSADFTAMYESFQSHVSALSFCEAKTRRPLPLQQKICANRSRYFGVVLSVINVEAAWHLGTEWFCSSLLWSSVRRLKPKGKKRPETKSSPPGCRAACRNSACNSDAFPCRD